MKTVKVKNYAEMSELAAEEVIATVRENPRAVLGLATGSTPLGLYANLAKDYEENGTSYSECRTVNLDEYVGLPPTHPQSYAYFMRKNLFEHIDIKPENTHIENGVAADETAECERYNALLSELRQDVQILGIGSNGHIAFNEPGTPFDSVTHTVELAESTVRDNARLFDSVDDVPRRAFTMGLANIMNARKIIILANGENKAEAVRALVSGEISEDVPATVLRHHADCTLICDEEAGKYI